MALDSFDPINSALALENKRLREALEKLANPMGEPKTEEAVLYQLEVERIASIALSGSEGSDR